MKLTKFMIAATTTVLFVACEKEPELYQGKVDYICFASEAQTIEVTPETTKANIEVQVALNVPIEQFTRWEYMYSVQVIEEASTAISGVHYNLLEGSMIAGETDIKHLYFDLIPENITEEVTLMLHADSFRHVFGANPDQYKYTGFDLVKLTLKPKQ